MSSLYRRALSCTLPAMLLASLGWGPRSQPSSSADANANAPLRVCADPNNLPFSNEKEEGFENRIASLIASDLGTTVEYTWWPQRRGFVRNTLRAKHCDVVMEVPSHYDLTAHTAPYYRSTYVFVTRTDRRISVKSFDDPALRRLRIGIHMMGDDYANSPAAVALARRGLASQVVPFMIYGDYSQPNPPARLIHAVAEDSIDVAVAWGPLAGYFAKRSRVPLTVTPMATETDGPAAQFVFDIAIGVRRGDSTRRALLDREIVKRRQEIRKILEEFGVPLVSRARANARGTP